MVWRGEIIILFLEGSLMFNMGREMFQKRGLYLKGVVKSRGTVVILKETIGSIKCFPWRELEVS